MSTLLVRTVRVIHLVALLMLLVAGGETLVCQSVRPDACDVGQSTDHPDQGSADDCLCCALAHVAQTFSLQPLTACAWREVYTPVVAPPPHDPAVYHPPI